MIAVAPLRARDEDAVDAFLLARPEVLVYPSSRYRALLRRLLGCEEGSLVARDGEAIRGFLPALAADGASGRVYNSLPYFGSNGGVVAADAEAAGALARAWDELTGSVGVLAGTIVTSPFAVEPHPEVVHNLEDDRIAQWTPLTADPLARVEASARRNVRKAEVNGVRVERDPSELARLYELHDANLRAIGGRPKRRAFFQLLPESLRPEHDFDLWVARVDGEVVAALLVLLFNRTVEYFTPAIEHSARPLQPLAAILARALPEYAERGYATWNWGGTWRSQESLLRFKRKWGAEERPYRYLVRVNDRSLLDRPASAILAEYEGFYVAPFSALRESGGA